MSWSLSHRSRKLPAPFLDLVVTECPCEDGEECPMKEECHCNGELLVRSDCKYARDESFNVLKMDYFGFQTM